MTKAAAKFGLALLAAALLTAPGPGSANAEAVAAGNCYGGQMPLKSGDIDISLCLYDKSFFILGQKQVARGKKRSRDICGKWRLAENNSILLLANSHGFEQKLNIGTGGLYGDFFAGQASLPKSLLLKKKSFEKIPFSGSGILRQTEKGLSLTEAASGRTFTAQISAGENFAALTGEMKSALQAGKPIFAEARLAPETGGGKILALRHVSDKLPGMVKEKSTGTRAGTFGEDVARSIWMTEIPEIGRASCRFTENAQKKSPGRKKRSAEKDDGSKKTAGLLEISAPGFRLEARYQTRDSRFTVKLRKNEIARLAVIGAGEFAGNLAAVESWQLEGDLLLLKGASIPDIVLRKFGKTS